MTLPTVLELLAGGLLIMGVFSFFGGLLWYSQPPIAIKIWTLLLSILLGLSCSLSFSKGDPVVFVAYLTMYSLMFGIPMTLAARHLWRTALSDAPESVSKAIGTLFMRSAITLPLGVAAFAVAFEIFHLSAYGTARLLLF